MGILWILSLLVYVNYAGNISDLNTTLFHYENMPIKIY